MPNGQRMEGLRSNAVHLGGDAQLEAGADLAGGLAREGDNHEGGEWLGLKDVGCLLDQHTRLAGAGAGDHDAVATMEDGGALLGVEAHWG